MSTVQEVVNIHVASQDECSHLAAELVATELVLEHPVIGLATGRSTVSLYEELVNMHHQGTINLNHATWVMLDEFVGIEPKDLRSFRQQLTQNLFDAFDRDGKKLIGPRLSLSDPEMIRADFSRATEDLVINLQILGIGRNGHIGFNEPGTPASSRTQLVNLDPSTINDLDPVDWEVTDQPICAVTRGIADIYEAQKLILLAFGSAKAQAIKGALLDPISPDCPASFLRDHPDLHVFIDAQAASLL